MPIRLDDDGLQVAVSDQPSVAVRALLTQSTHHPIRFVLAPESDIQWAIDSSYRAIGGVDTLVEAFEAVEGYRRTRAARRDETEVVADDAPIVQVVTRILTQAKRDRASDVHIEPSQDVVRVRFRIDGALKEVLMLPATMGVGLVSRIKIMAGMNIVERRRPQDGQLTTAIDGKDTDVRVSTAATIWGEKCVMRILDKNRSVLRLHDLGMPTDTHETFSQLVKAPFGMVLCAGPTGSGKTTTLYATLGQVSDPTKQRHDDRGPGRIHLPLDQPDPDQRTGGTDLRHRPEVDSAPGPGRDPRRRDPRRRDGPDRRPVRADRPPGPVVAARDRLGVRPAPLPRHGDRVVPDRLVGHRHRRAAPRSAHLPVVQDARTRRPRRR